MNGLFAFFSAVPHRRIAVHRARTARTRCVADPTISASQTSPESTHSLACFDRAYASALSPRQEAMLLQTTQHIVAEPRHRAGGHDLAGPATGHSCRIRTRVLLQIARRERNAPGRFTSYVASGRDHQETDP